jgi:membrane-associated phospholipid phosphatase
MKSNLATIRFSPRRCAALLVIIIACMSSAFAQTPTSTPPTPRPSPTPSLERKFLKNILRDQRAIWTSPLHLEKEDAKWLAPLGLSTAALIATDRRTADALDDNSTRLNVSHAISYLGSGYGASSIAATFYLIGRAGHNARARETGLLGGEALIDSGIVAAVLKSSTQRPRPRAGKERGDFFDGGLSFPSGHTIAAWSLATVVANEYRDNRLVQISAYGLAAAVSVSRYTGRNHFLSDVLVGSAIGYGIGRYVYRSHHDPALESISQHSPHAPSKLLPLIIPRYERTARNYGVALVWRL